MESKKIVCVTGCPVGIAHTFMASNGLIKAGGELGYEVKAETHGASGPENVLTQVDIDNADIVIIACDKNIDMDRFNSKKLLRVSVKEAVKNPKNVIEKALLSATPYESTSKSFSNKESLVINSTNGIYSALMSGVSQMVPFVITGGLLIALSLALGGKPTETGLAIPEGSAWNSILNIGVVAFTFMIPILSAYIAFSIADKPALVAGFIGGWIANTGSFYGATAGTGFLGAIVAGFIVGYLVKWMRTWKFPSIIASLAPLMFIPILSSLAVGLLFIYVIGAPIANLMIALNNMLSSLSTGNIVLVGIVLGLMQGFDMGGPFSKVAFLFSVGLIAEGRTEFMGAQAIAIPVAPIGMGLSVFIGRFFNTYDDTDYDAAKASLAMGCVGISEGAIPFAVKYPLAVIPANMIGTAVACVLGFLIGAKNGVAHGGPIIVLLGSLTPAIPALLAMLAGSLVTAFTAIGINKILIKK